MGDIYMSQNSESSVGFSRVKTPVSSSHLVPFFFSITDTSSLWISLQTSSVHIWAEPISAPSNPLPWTHKRPLSVNPESSCLGLWVLALGALLASQVTPEQMLLGIAHNQRQMESWWINPPAPWPLGWDNSEVRLTLFQKAPAGLPSGCHWWWCSWQRPLADCLSFLTYLALPCFISLIGVYWDCRQTTYIYILFSKFDSGGTQIKTNIKIKYTHI